MTPDARRLLAEAEKVVGLRGSFDPADVGKRIGLSPGQSETAARTLSNSGVLVLGFDNAAHFTSDYRKAHTPAEPKAAKASLKAKADGVGKVKADSGAKAKVNAKVKTKSSGAKKARRAD